MLHEATTAVAGRSALVDAINHPAVLCGSAMFVGQRVDSLLRTLLACYILDPRAEDDVAEGDRMPNGKKVHVTLPRVSRLAKPAGGVMFALGGVARPAILHELLATEHPLPEKKPHVLAKAKHVIGLFSTGGISQMDTFDYKPKFVKVDGKAVGSGGGLSNQQKPFVKPLWDFKPGSKCGTFVSDSIPHIRDKMDGICVIKSMKSDDNECYQATHFSSWIAGGGCKAGSKLRRER